MTERGRSRPAAYTPPPLGRSKKISNTFFLSFSSLFTLSLPPLFLPTYAKVLFIASSSSSSTWGYHTVIESRKRRRPCSQPDRRTLDGRFSLWERRTNEIALGRSNGAPGLSYRNACCNAHALIIWGGRKRQLVAASKSVERQCTSMTSHEEQLERETQRERERERERETQCVCSAANVI